MYALRNAALWGKEEELKWLLDCCTEVVSQIGPAEEANATYGAYLASQRAQYAHLLAVNSTTDDSAPLTKYEYACVADYDDHPPRLPEDLALIDPSLDDPQYVLSGQVRFREFMDPEGRFLFPVPHPYVSTIKPASHGYIDDEEAENAGGARRGGGGGVLNVLGGWMGMGQHNQNTDNDNNNNNNNNNNGHHDHAGRAARPRGIDLGLPLMQLFLATILPWVHVDPLQRQY